jgi:hypothetical protein
LSHRAKLFLVVTGEILDLMVRRNEVDLVLLTNNLASIFCLVVLFAYISRFIVEKTMGISHPGYTSEEHTTKSNLNQNLHGLFTWSFFNLAFLVKSLDLASYILLRHYLSWKFAD